MSKYDHPTPICMEDMGYIALFTLAKNSVLGSTLRKTMVKPLFPMDNRFF